MQLTNFFPKSIDVYLKAQEDMALAKFGHINYITKYVPSIAVTTVATSSGASNTTLADITGLSLNVDGGYTYSFKASIPITCVVTGGAKVGFGGTCTLTSINATAMYMAAAALAVGNTTTATIGTAIGGSTALVTYINVEGTFVVATSGTFTLKIAQNASDATATQALINSTLSITRI